MTTTRKTRRRSTMFAKNPQAIAAQATTPAAAPTPAPAENMGRGKLLGPSDIEAMLGGLHTLRWIVRNVAHASRRRVGRRPLWFEADVIAWIDDQTDGGA